MDDAALGVGRMAAVGALVGDFLRGDTLGDDIGLVGGVLGRGPDRLPVYVLGAKEAGMTDKNAYQG